MRMTSKTIGYPMIHLILISFFTVHTTNGQTKISWCYYHERESAPKELEQQIGHVHDHRYDLGICLFDIIGAAEQATNRTVDGKLVSFDFGYARNACQKIHATLPTLRDLGEVVALHDAGRSSHSDFIQIRATASKSEGHTTWEIVRWDDDLGGLDDINSRILKMDDEKNHPKDMLGAVQIIDEDHRLRFKILFDRQYLTNMRVYCEQDMTQMLPFKTTTPTQTPRSPPPGTPVYWCDTESREKAPKTMINAIEVFREYKAPEFVKKEHGSDKLDSCFFEVKGATKKANKQVRPKDTKPGYEFDIEYARSICHEFYAILPTFRTFYEDYFLTSEFLPNSAIAAGVTVYRNHIGGKDYWNISKWDDDLPGYISSNDIKGRYYPGMEDDIPGLAFYGPFNYIIEVPFRLWDQEQPKVEVICKQNRSRFFDSNGTPEPYLTQSHQVQQPQPKVQKLLLLLDHQQPRPLMVRKLHPYPQIQSLFFPADSIPQPIQIVWCDPESRNLAPIHMRERVLPHKIWDFREYNGACYFEIEGVTREANHKINADGRRIRIDLQYAHKKCQEYFGMLVTIRDEDEEGYLNKTFTHSVALGAEMYLDNVTNGRAYWDIKYWDDGLPGMKPRNSLVKEHKENDQDNILALVMRRVDNCRELHIRRKFHWYILFNYNGDEYGSEDITVLCKQNVTGMRKPGSTKGPTHGQNTDSTSITSSSTAGLTPINIQISTETPTISTPKPSPIIWCDEELRNSAPKAMREKIRLEMIKDHRKENGACYFQIQGVTEESNRRETMDGRKIFFDVKYAREQCQKFYGTLVTSRDEKEQNNIGNMFSLFTVFGADVKLVNQGTNPPEWIVEKWDDGLPGMEARNPLVKEYKENDEQNIQALIMHKKNPFEENQIGREFWWFILFNYACGSFPDITVICKQNVTKPVEATTGVTSTPTSTSTLTNTSTTPTKPTPTQTGSDPNKEDQTTRTNTGVMSKSIVFSVIMVAYGVHYGSTCMPE